MTKRFAVALALFAALPFSFPSESWANQCAPAFSIELNPAERTFVNLVMALTKNRLLTENDLRALTLVKNPSNPLSKNERSIAAKNYSQEFERLIPKIQNWEHITLSLEAVLIELRGHEVREDRNRKETSKLLTSVEIAQTPTLEPEFSPQLFEVNSGLKSFAKGKDEILLLHWRDRASPRIERFPWTERTDLLGMAPMIDGDTWLQPLSITARRFLAIDWSKSSTPTIESVRFPREFGNLRGQTDAKLINGRRWLAFTTEIDIEITGETVLVVANWKDPQNPDFKEFKFKNGSALGSPTIYSDTGGRVYVTVPTRGDGYTEIEFSNQNTHRRFISDADASMAAPKLLVSGGLRILSQPSPSDGGITMWDLTSNQKYAINEFEGTSSWIRVSAPFFWNGQLSVAYAHSKLGLRVATFSGPAHPTFSPWIALNGAGGVPVVLSTKDRLIVVGSSGERSHFAVDFTDLSQPIAQFSTAKGSSFSDSFLVRKNGTIFSLNQNNQGQTLFQKFGSVKD